MLSKRILFLYVSVMQKLEFKHLKIGLLLALLVASCVAAINYEIDLVNIYVTAKFLVTDITRTYMKNEPYGRYFYGPISLVLIKPFAYMSWVVVKYFWILLQTVCFVAFWKMLNKLYPFLLEKKANWAWVVVLVVSINPLHNNFQSNNIQLMLMAIFLYSELLSYEKSGQKQFWSGALISLAALIKVFPAFLAAYYFVVKPKKVKLGVVLGALLWLVVPFAVFGWNDSLLLYKGFFEHLFTYNNEENSFLKVQDLLCLPSLIARILSNASPEQISLVTKSSILLVSGGFFISALNKFKTPVTKKDSLRYWALALALMTFLNPSTRPHYFIFYVPAFCALLEVLYENTASWWVKLSTVLSVLMIAFTAQGVTGKQLNDKLELLSVPTWGMLILCVALTALLITEKKSELS